MQSSKINCYLLQEGGASPDSQTAQIFAGVLNQKLEEISTSFDVPLHKVCDVCLLHRKQSTSNAY